MQQSQLSLWKSKQLNNNNKSHPPKCKVRLTLVVIVLSLLWLQVVLYQRIQDANGIGMTAVDSTVSKNQQASLLQVEEVPPRSLHVVDTNKARQQLIAAFPTSDKQVSENRDSSISVKDANIREEQSTASRRSNSPPSETPLPDWIRNYVAWHKQMREKFPGTKLWEDPEAPKLLVRTCLGLCGGLNDRLGQLPWDLYLANQTNRVLLMNWHRPVPLEHFLIPSGDLDWRVPEEIPGFFPAPNQRTISRQGLQKIRQEIKDLFQDYESANPTEEFWTKDFPLALQRAQSGAFASEKILRHRLLGHLHEHVLEERLAALGETDMIHNTATFGNIFRLFFRLAPPVQTTLDEIYRNLGLQVGAYSAVHCRVRHPKAVVGLVKGKDENYPADKTGLPWDGETRENAIGTAVRALRCAQTLQSHAAHADPIYFFSDSNDLVRYMSSELYNGTFVDEHEKDFTASKTEKSALQLSQTVKILARPCDDENAHIDRQKGREKDAYYGTFLDLFLAINARCVTYGIGFYAVFATKVSHVQCKLLYQEEAWGGSERKRLDVPLCTLDEEA